MTTLTNGGGVDASIFAVVWANASIYLQDALGPDKFRDWISPLKPLPGQGGRLILESPSHFFRTYVSTAHMEEIKTAVQEACYKLSVQAMPVDLTSNDDDMPMCPARPSDWQEVVYREPRLQGLDGQNRGYTQPFDPWNTFANFVVGESNQMAYECCQAFSNDRQLGNNLLMVLSDPGLGKSHLAQAAGSEVVGKARNVCYLTARDYSTHYVSAVQKKDFETFNADYKKSDLLVLEDVTFFSKKPQFQNEICAVIDFLLNKGAKVVLTSHQPPSDIPFLSPACRSRLSAALMTPIKPPTYETRLKILTNLVKAFAYKIPTPVLELVAQNVSNDIRLLRSCLTSIQAKSDYEKKPVSVALAKDVLAFSTTSPPCGEALDKIKTLICGVYSVDEAALVSRSVSKTLNKVRSIGIYLSKHMTSHSYAEIGRAYNRQHSSVIYTYNKMVTALETDDGLRNAVDYLIKQLGKTI
ncbi:MAG: ATP-binding protein [Deltaproteobacteria bacterium]|jgi:chromosomal replication initiator protein|nr:ATP-binding protein [Deltaproteobacteria bacterium]